MVCQRCGGPVAGPGSFCSRCGMQVAGLPMAYSPFAPRVQRHLQTLGILWCVFGAYRLVSGVAGMFFLKMISLHGFGSDGWNPWGGYGTGPHWMAALVPVIGAYTVVVTALALFVGFSLLTRKPWGRTLGVVVAILTLLRPLLGTALGIYTLWVLAPSASAAEYDAIAEPS